MVGLFVPHSDGPLCHVHLTFATNCPQGSHVVCSLGVFYSHIMFDWISQSVIDLLLCAKLVMIPDHSSLLLITYYFPLL
jgi:hypothetical protein